MRSNWLTFDLLIFRHRSSAIVCLALNLQRLVCLQISMPLMSRRAPSQLVWNHKCLDQRSWSSILSIVVNLLCDIVSFVLSRHTARDTHPLHQDAAAPVLRLGFAVAVNGLVERPYSICRHALFTSCVRRKEGTKLGIPIGNL